MSAPGANITAVRERLERLEGKIDDLLRSVTQLNTGFTLIKSRCDPCQEAIKSHSDRLSEIDLGLLTLVNQREFDCKAKDMISKRSLWFVLGTCATIGGSLGPGLVWLLGLLAHKL